MPPLTAALIGRQLALRPERPGDLAFCRALYRAARLRELVFLPWSPAQKEQFLDDQFRLQSAHYAQHARGADRLIVERADEPIGRLYAAREPQRWRLLDIGLIPAAQGQGLGSLLIGWLEAGAAAAGAARLELQVAADNVGALALYRRLGFVEQPSDSATHLAMAKPLGG